MKRLHGLQCLADDAVYSEFDSPVGVLTIISSVKGLSSILWDIERNNLDCETILNNLTKSESEKIIVKTKKQLSEYFDGKRQIFDLPINLNGTDFQKQVWQQLLKIPYGETISYGEQAKRLGDKNKARAVGFANGCNPISIVVPCHRVIGSSGKLVGFGGGLDKKTLLLDLERSITGP